VPVVRRESARRTRRADAPLLQRVRSPRDGGCEQEDGLTADVAGELLELRRQVADLTATLVRERERLRVALVRADALDRQLRVSWAARGSAHRQR
jgi:hypothetical protein